MAAYWFTVSWLPDFMNRAWGLSIAKSGLWTLAFVAGSLTGYLLFGVVSDRIGRRLSFSAFAGLMAVSLGLLTLPKATYTGTPHLVLLFAFAAGIGTGTWSSFGPLYTEIFPAALRTTASGICMNVTRGVQFLAPVLVIAVGGEGLARGIALAALFAFLAGVTVWLLPETRAKRIEVARR
jgi:MFS family permease